MRIRPASPFDGDAIHALVQRAYGHYVDRIGRRPGPMDEDYGKKICDGGVFVAEDSALAGVIVLVANPDHVLIENIALYSRLGYEEVDRRTDDGFERVFFLKRLSPGLNSR